MPGKKNTAIIITGCLIILFFAIGKNLSCSRTIITQTPSVVSPNEIACWLTKGDESVKLMKQKSALSFDTVTNSNTFIEVDSTQSYQTIDGFGYTLTGGSAYLVNRLNATEKAGLLTELFGSAPNSIGISYLRISMGASDLNDTVFSYDDMAVGKADTGLAAFSLAPDKKDLIPLLKEIISIKPSVKIIAVPWSPPVWMKDNGNTKGGSLQPRYYNAYAGYFVKYIQQMGLEGITIDAIAPQNEPLNPDNNPSLLMLAEQQRDFIKNNLGPAFRAAGITTKIIAYDHNCDHPEYPLTILDDPAASAFTDGSAFHLYGGDISALSTLHDAHPHKNVYLTEQWTSSEGSFGGDLKWHVKNVIIGSMRNHSKVALEWNLANDPNFGPHTPGGCTQCKGALTIGATITRNVAYYIIAHASRFVPAGSVRIGSNITGALQNVAFKTPTGKKVLIIENDGAHAETFNIRFKNKWAVAYLEAGAVGTYIW